MIHINNQPKLTAKQSRWITNLNLFNYSIVYYREGKSNKVADGLSRQFYTQMEKEDDDSIKINKSGCALTMSTANFAG